MSIFKMRFGTPEEFVPSKYAPAPKCEIIEGLPEDVTIDCRFTKRGTILTMPIDPQAGVYGFGLMLHKFQQRGQKKTIRCNADPRDDTGDTHAPVPFVVTTSGWGIYVDSARYVEFYNGKCKLRDTGKDAKPAEKREVAMTTDELYAARNAGVDTIMTIEVPLAPGVDIYYIKGDTILDIVSQYNMLSGGGCMPALWGLGGFYRCCGRFNQEQVLAMARKNREYGIPCDIWGLEPGWQTCSYSCSYVWDRNGRFPDPEGLLRELKDMQYHVNLWEHAYVHPTAPVYNDLKPYAGKYEVFNMGLVPDFSIPEAQDIFAAHQKTLLDMGVTGFKLDECDGSDITGGWSFPNCDEFPSGMDGEQYHNMLGVLYCKTLMKAFGNNRTFSESRSMGALAASYPFVLYSDLFKHDEFIRGVVTSGFSGVLWAPEVRIYCKSRDELLRRIQTVIFSVQALINAWNTEEIPWERFDCTDEVRRLFQIRMQLVPYLYTAFYDYKMTGKPPVRALVCDYQDEAECWDCDNEYLFGDAMIVAPITADDNGERDVWLPKGIWYNFFTGEKYEGGTHHIVTEDIPVFVKAGTLLPLAEPVVHMSDDMQFAVTLRAYGDCSGAVCRLIEDDGVTNGTEMKVITVTAEHAVCDSFRYRITGVEKI